MTQHTPGPWPYKPTGDHKRIIVGRGLVDGPNGYDVAEVYSDDCDYDEAEANARLIAAAPDLLAALRRLDGLLDFDLDEAGAADWAKQMGMDEGAGDLLAACQDARAAIARADGR